MRTVRCSDRRGGGGLLCLPGASTWGGRGSTRGGLPHPPAQCMLEYTHLSCPVHGGITSPAQCMLGYTPPDRIFLTHACENITFPQLLLRMIKMQRSWKGIAFHNDRWRSNFIHPPTAPGTSMFSLKVVGFIWVKKIPLPAANEVAVK